jgi:hypothetical protein
MKENGNHRSIAGAALLLALLLAACGSTSKKSTSPATASTQAASSFVGMQTCTSCHTTQTADWLTSRHANLDPSGTLDSPGYPTLAGLNSGGTNTADCVGCHDSTGDSNNLTAGYTGNVRRPVIGCEACHGAGSLHAAAGGAGPISLSSDTSALSFGTISVSGQFVMCTTCHQLLDTSTGALNAAPAHMPVASDETVSGSQYIITDTHYAQPLTFLASGSSNTTIAGYAMDFNDPTVCTNCHNPHKPADILKDWAASKHAYRALDSSTFYGAWNHYNMTCDGTTTAFTCGPKANSVPQGATGATYINDRRLCQRCHTTTGYKTYMNALIAGDTALASRLHDGTQSGTDSSLTFTTVYKPEMLECTGCHTDNRGTLRNAGAYTGVYQYRVTNVGAASGTMSSILSSASAQFPDVSSSNVCIPCHSGRTNGASIAALNSSGAPTTVDFSVLKSTDSHDFPTAGIMFRTLGYQFGGRSYADEASYRHFHIGTPLEPNTGSGGPCVGCHMYRAGSAASHLFEAVSKTGEAITGVSSPVCFTCHAGSTSQVALMAETERENYDAATEALGYSIANAGLVTCATSTAVPVAANACDYRDSTNYALTFVTNYLSSGDTDSTGNTTGKNNLGATFNFRAFLIEPGAFVHNSRYVKRLLYDSIDWLDDGQLNNSVGSFLTSTTGICGPGGPAWCSGAASYLLPNGVTGASSERP